MASEINNVFNDMPSLAEIKADIKNFIEYDKTNDEQYKPTIFNSRGTATFPKRGAKNSPMMVQFKINSKTNEIILHLEAKVDKTSPRFTGEEKIKMSDFTSKSFDYNDFSKLINKAINNFKSNDDTDNYEELFNRAGVDEDTFFDQIIETAKDELGAKDADSSGLTNIIKEMMTDRKFGFKYFESKLVSKSSADGFKYDEIAKDAMNLYLKSK